SAPTGILNTATNLLTGSVPTNLPSDLPTTKLPTGTGGISVPTLSGSPIVSHPSLTDLLTDPTKSVGTDAPIATAPTTFKPFMPTGGSLSTDTESTESATESGYTESTVETGTTDTKTASTPTTTSKTTSQWFSSSLIIDVPPSTTEKAPTGITPSKTGTSQTMPAHTTTSVEPEIPSNLPKVITPIEGMPAQPADMVLIRLGFDYALNYPFVVKHPVTVAQMFDYLPKAINYGLNITNCTMHSLQPYDTREDKKYITTLALAYIPADLFNQLDNDRKLPNSLFRNNPDKPIHDLVGLVQGGIALGASPDEQSGDANGKIDNSNDNWSPNSDSGNGSDDNDGAPIGSGSGDQKISMKSVGIGSGLCVGALLYGGAMFIVARRYKQRRGGRHSRANSMSRSISPGSNPAGALMGQVPGRAMMHGAGGAYGAADKRGSKGSGKASARTANISGPMMAENSLGWN
ncbi:hypothetical protein EDC01DRAFT_623576, partial [Geopyxis carbonaria]